MPEETGAAAEREVVVTAGDASLAGTLAAPAAPRGVVLFAHGSGSSRFSPRNRFVAAELRKAGLATLLIDLLTRAEEVEDQATGALRFDIDLLARRVVAAVDWLGEDPATAALPVGLFGASTGAAAALVAASLRPARVAAVVSRGGRPDMADRALALVGAPTLLLVGECDTLVISLNRQALARLRCEKELVIVPGAGHLFEEPGTLEEVAARARDWFRSRLPSAG